MDQSAPFGYLFQSPSLPDPSDDIFDAIEGFLISGFDDAVKSKIELIVDYLVHLLPPYAKIPENFDKNKIRMQGRVLSLLHLLNPLYLNPKLSTQIEESLFQILKVESPLRTTAFSTLFDHMMSAPHGVPDRLIELRQWYQTFLKNAVVNIFNYDHNFLLFLISCYKSNPPTDRSHLPQYFEIPLNIANECLNLRDSAHFFPNLEQICSKSIRALTRFLENTKEVPGFQRYDLLNEIDSKIPREPPYFHIYQNYLLLCSAIFAFGEQKVQPHIVNTVRNEVLNNMQIFSFEPLLSSRRTILYFSSCITGMSDFSNKQLITNLISFAFNLIKVDTKIAAQFLNKITNPSNAQLQQEFPEQLMSLLELFSDYYLENPNQWGDISYWVAKMIKDMLSNFIKNSDDEKESRFDLLIRYTKYVSKILDVYADLYVQVRDKEVELPKKYEKIPRNTFRKFLEFVFEDYIQIVINLSVQKCYFYFNRYIYLLVPKSPLHSYNMNFIFKIHKSIKSPAALLISLIDYITKNPDTVQTLTLQILHRGIYEFCFVDPVAKIQEHEPTILLTELFKLFLLSIHNCYVNILDTVFIEILYSYHRQRKQTHRFEHFITLIKSNSSIWGVGFLGLQPELTFSRLSILIFPILEVSPDDKTIDVWFSLFIPAIDAVDDKKKDILYVYTAVQNNLSEYFAKLQRHTQLGFFTAITKYLNKNRSAVPYILNLISDHVMQISQDISIQLPKNKNLSTFVTIENRQVSLEIVYEAMENADKYDIDFLVRCIYQCLLEQPYKKSCANKTIDKIISYIKNNDIEKLRNLPDTYSGYYYKYYLFDEIVIPEEKTEDFIIQSSFLYSSKNHVEKFLSLVDKLFERFTYSEKIVKLSIPMIYLSSRYTENSINVIKHHLIDKYEENEENDKVFVNMQKTIRLAQTDSFTPYLSHLSIEIGKHPIVLKNRKKSAIDPLRIKKYMEVSCPEYQTPYFNFPFSEIETINQIFTMAMDMIKDDKISGSDPKPLFRSSKYQDHILYLVMQGITTDFDLLVKRDVKLINFFKMRGVYKILAHTLIGFTKDMPNAEQNVNLAFHVFDDYANRQYLPFFLREIEEAVSLGLGNYDAWTKDMNQILSIDLDMPSTASLRMLLFFTKTGHFTNCSSTVLNVICRECIYLEKRFPDLKRERIYKDLDLVFEIMTCCAKQEGDDMDAQPFIKAIIDLTIKMRTNAKNPVIVPLEKIVTVPQFESLFVKNLAFSFSKDNNFSCLAIMQDLFVHPQCQSFAMACIQQVFQNYGPLQNWLKNSPPIFHFYITSHFFNCLGEISRNKDTTSANLFSVVKIALRVFSIVFPEMNTFNPTFFSSLMDSLIPPNVENYCSDEPLVDAILTGSVPFILQRYNLFFHPVMVGRMATFLSVCNNIVSQKLNSLLEIQNSLTSLLSLSFFRQVLCKYFTSCPPENEVRINFSQFTSDTSLFEKFIYDYSTSQLLQFDNVVIDGIKESSSYIYTSLISDIFIKKGLQSKSDILTMGRVVKSCYRGTIDMSNEFRTGIESLQYFSSLAYHLLRECQNIPESACSIEISRFLTGFGINFIQNTKQNSQQILQFIKYLSIAAPQMDKRYYTPLFNSLISLILYYFENVQPKDYCSIIVNMCPIFDVITKDLDMKHIHMTHFNKFRDYLREKIEGMDKNIVLHQLRFVYMVIKSMAKYLWLEKDYFPQPMYINPFLENQTMELIKYYKEALKSAVLYGPNVWETVLTDLSNFYSKKKIILPPILQTPFATLITWYNDVAPNETHSISVIEYLIDAMKPQTVSMLIKELHNIVLPISPKFTKIIIELIQSFPSFNDRIQNLGSMTIYKKLKKSDDLKQKIWEIDWLAMPGSTHLYTFASVLLPDPLSEYILYISEENIYQMMTETILNLPFSIRRFVMFYTHICPDTSLSSFFRTTSSYHDSIPLPHKGAVSNIQYLSDLSMFDDALAIAELQSKEFMKAVKYNQLNNYEAASQCYLDIMNKKNENFSLAFCLFSPVRANLKYSMEPSKYCEPSSFYTNMPFVKMFASNAEKDQILNSIKYPQTRFLHPLLVAVQRRMALFEYVQINLKNNIDDKSLTKLRQIPINSLDLSNVVSSILGFRTYFIQARAANKVPNTPPISYNSLLSVNYSKLSNLLGKHGTNVRALRVFATSIKYAELHYSQQTMNQSAQQLPIINFFNQQIDQSNGYPVNKLNMARVYKFLSSSFNVQVKPLFATRQNYFLVVRDISGFLSSRSQNDFNTLSDVYTFMYNYCPNSIKTENVYESLLGSAGQKNSEQSYYITTLAFAILKKFPDSEKFFLKAMEKHYKEKMSVWLRWLPHFFTVFSTPPTEVLSTLLKAQPLFFRAILRNVNASNAAINKNLIVEELNKIIKESQYAQYQIAELDSIFKWTQQCEEDIDRFKQSAFVMMKTLEELAFCRQQNEEVTKLLNGQDLSQFLKERPAYFKTNLKCLDMGYPRGFKIPMRGNFHHGEIEAPGDKEATLTFTTYKGSQIVYTISLSYFYPPNFSEDILIFCLQKIFETHPSSAMRSAFVYAGQIYYLHKDLVLINGKNFSLPTISNTNIVLELLKQNPNREVKNSPKDIFERRNINKKNDSLFTWISKGAKGNIVDFLHMKQCLSSFIASLSALKFLFTNEYSLYPNIVFSINRQNCFIPNVTKLGTRVVHLPLTDTIRGALPLFSLKGIFSATWQTIMESINSKRDKVKVILGGLCPKPDETSASVLRRAEICATNVNEDTEKEDNPFPFMLLDHLIQNSGNAIKAQESGFGWI